LPTVYKGAQLKPGESHCPDLSQGERGRVGLAAVGQWPEGPAIQESHGIPVSPAASGQWPRPPYLMPRGVEPFGPEPWPKARVAPGGISPNMS